MTTSRHAQRRPTSRRRRAAAAILLACATTATGAAVGTITSKPAAATDPICTLKSAPLPIDVVVILDATDIPTDLEDPPTSTSTSAPTASVGETLYNADALESFMKVLSNSIDGSVRLFASSTDALKTFKLGNTKVMGTTPNELKSVIALNSTRRSLVLNYSTQVSRSNVSDRDMTWVGTDDVKPDLTDNAANLGDSISTLLQLATTDLRLVYSPIWSTVPIARFQANGNNQISFNKTDLRNWTRKGTPISDGGPVPYGNAKVSAVMQDGTSVPCAGSNKQMTFPVDATVSNASGAFSFLVQPPSSAATGDANSSPVFLVGGVKSLLPHGSCVSSAKGGKGRATTDAAPQATVLPSCKKAADPPTTFGKNSGGSGGSGASKTAILGGGIAGLLVGAGAGAGLMAVKRKDRYGPDGRHMAGQHPYSGPPPNRFDPGPGGAGGLGALSPLGGPSPTGTGGAVPGAPAGRLLGSAAASGAAAAAGAATASAAGNQRPGVGAVIGGSATTHDWTVAAPGGGTVRLEDIGVNRIMPVATEHGRVWAVGSGTYAATAGWIEKKKGKGEDAEPTLRVHSSGRGIIGVYDGTGGAGAAIARTTGEGTDLSAAYVAARLVRDVVEAWFVDCVGDGDRALETGGLAATLQQVLKEEAQYLPESRSNVRGKLHRILPTTAACVAFDADDPSGTVDALWAGDSRCFLLTPTKGLQVLSKDDTREGDALELIRNDQPMENLVAADRPFRINHRRFTPEQPMVLLTATDGAFGYVRTPAHFEYLLLHTLVSAETLDDWSAKLIASFAEFAADDVSFSIVAIGFSGFDELQKAVRARHDYLEREHWKPFVDNTGAADAIERLREESWVVYRDLYQARLNGPDAAVAADARPDGQ